jgi:3-deoxy-manno-octulosonate cytidylyltransferase (CMP-KDO synthetase)
MKTTLIIPARYASQRFPGKPLAKIAGKTMLARVCEIARSAIASMPTTTTTPQTQILVATDDQRIVSHAQDLGVAAIMTPKECPTGSDRVLAAIDQLPEADQPDYVINLQGDVPLTPPHFVRTLLQVLQADAGIEIITPVVQLSWGALDALRDSKKITPFSGTTAMVQDGHALWFSKNIIPAMRNEGALRQASALSPVYRHIGIYGYRLDVLRAFVGYPVSHYEQLEGLEQLRALTHGHKIRAVPVDYGEYPAFTGIDSPEDAVRAEKLLQENPSFQEMVIPQ